MTPVVAMDFIASLNSPQPLSTTTTVLQSEIENSEY